jgi:hypothetical protein
MESELKDLFLEDFYEDGGEEFLEDVPFDSIAPDYEEDTFDEILDLLEK